MMPHSGELERNSHPSSGVIFILGLCTLSIFIQVSGFYIVYQGLFTFFMLPRRPSVWDWETIFCLVILHRKLIERLFICLSLITILNCQVLLEDEPVSTRQVLLTVLNPNNVEHKTKYVITKQGGNITLDCTDFEGEDVNWVRLGGEQIY